MEIVPDPEPDDVELVDRREERRDDILRPVGLNAAARSDSLITCGVGAERVRGRRMVRDRWVKSMARKMGGAGAWACMRESMNDGNWDGVLGI